MHLHMYSYVFIYIYIYINVYIYIPSPFPFFSSTYCEMCISKKDVQSLTVLFENFTPANDRSIPGDIDSRRDVAVRVQEGLPVVDIL